MSATYVDRMQQIWRIRESEREGFVLEHLHPNGGVGPVVPAGTPRFADAETAIAAAVAIANGMGHPVTAMMPLGTNVILLVG